MGQLAPDMAICISRLNSDQAAINPISPKLVQMNFFISSAFICARSALLALPLFSGAGFAADDASIEPKPVLYKFTTGLYQLSGGNLPAGPSLDVNLRTTSQLGNAWVGWFRSPVQTVTQSRAGWDHTFKLGPARLMPSVQIASGGFVGGSASLEAGDSWFAGVGVGRTNLRNYVNLNFDPNDAWMLSGGYRWSDSNSLALQLVRDNRLNPDQQHLHVVYRQPLPDDERLTLDLLAKRGLVAGVPIQRFGVSVVYDWPRYFMRVAWDPLVNFTQQDMLRLSVGTRF